MAEPISTVATLASTIGTPALIVVVILKLVFDFLRDKKNNGVNTQCNLDTQITHELDDIKKIVIETDKTTSKVFDMHNTKDGDGVYSWYVPRSWAETQKDIVGCLQKISGTQEAIAGTLERMERREEKKND